MKSTWERILAGDMNRPRSNDWEEKRNLVQAIADEIDAVRDLVSIRDLVADTVPLPDSRFKIAAALVREALEVTKNAYEEGQGSASFPWSMANAEQAVTNIEKALEALEKEA